MGLGARRLAAAALAIGLGASGCFWSAPGAGPGRGGHNPFEKEISPETVDGLEEAWSAPVAGAALAPTTSDAAVHVAAGPTVYGFDTETGDLLWERTPVTPDDCFKMRPAIFFRDVLWSSGGCGVTTWAPWVAEFLDPATGNVVGEPEAVGAVDSVVGEGYVLSRGDFASALGPGYLIIDVRDSEDRNLGWRARIAFLNGVTWSPLTLGVGFVYLAGQGAPVVHDGNPVISNGVGAYSTKEQPEDCPPLEPPYDILGTFVCPSWFTALEGGTTTAPVLDFGTSTLFVGTYGLSDETAGSMHALDASTGDILWSTPVGAGVPAEPALANGNVYVLTADGRLVVLDADSGDVLWEATAGDSLEIQPAVAGGVVFTGATDGSVHAFDAGGCGTETCEPLWTDSTGSAITGAPAVSRGQLYVGTDDGRLIAYSLT